MTYAALLLYFGLEYVRPSSYWPSLLALHLNSIVPLLTLSASIATSAASAKARVFADPNSAVVVGLLLLVSLSVLTADVQLLSWNVLVMVGGFASIYWLLCCELTTISRIKGVFTTLIVVHLIVAFLNPVLFTDPNNRHYIASGSFLGDGNDFALSVGITVPMCLFLLLESRLLFKMAWAGCLLLLVAGIITTQSRGGTVGLVATGLYFWLKSPKKVRVAAMAAVVVALVLALAPPEYFVRMNMIADTEEGSASARIAAWKIGMRMAMDNPILGVGAGHFGIKTGNEYRTADIIGSGMNAHSIYFQALGELGLPGLSLLLYFLISNFLANRRLAREIKERGDPANDRYIQLLSTTSAGLLAFATAGAFLSAVYYPHWFVLAGLLSGVRHIAREQAFSTVTAHPSHAPRQIAYHPALRPRPAQQRLPPVAAGARR